MTRKTGKAGARYGNKLAWKHGAYVEKWDSRTREARAVKEIQARLVSALGGDPSPQEILLIQRAAVKALRCALLEAAMFGNGQLAERTEQHYIRWARELRSDLQALGLSRKQKPVMDLQAYCAQKYGGSDESDQ